MEICLVNKEMGIASLQIATDEEPNFPPDFLVRLTETVDQINHDKSLRVIVIEGGNRYFSAGASLNVLVSASSQVTLLHYAADLSRQLLSINIPTIAAMTGHAIGGGFIFGIWCDMVVLAKESMYGANFMALGFTPGMGATTILQEVVGETLARELLFTGRIMTGKEFKEMGSMLAHAIVPRDEVRSRAFQIAEEVAGVPREGLVLLKKTLTTRRRAALEDAARAEGEMHAAIFADSKTPHYIEKQYIKPTIHAEEMK